MKNLLYIILLFSTVASAQQPKKPHIGFWAVTLGMQCDSLKTTLTAPVTVGTTKLVIVDTNGKFSDVPFLGNAEANTASNLSPSNPNTGGIYSSKTGVNFNLRQVSSTNTGGITVSQLTNEVQIADNMWQYKGYSTYTTVNAVNGDAKVLTSLLPSNCVGHMVLHVDQVDRGASGAGGSVITVFFKKISGTLTIINTVTNSSSSSTIGSSSFTVINDGSNNLDINVTGAASHTIDWSFGIEVIYAIPLA